jgi:phage tail sheath protein FI
MPEYLAPGVYVEEVSFRAKSIEGVPTSTTGYAGMALTGPVQYSAGGERGPSSSEPRLITSFTEFERVYGGLDPLLVDGAERPVYLAHAARAFFMNGGKRLYVSRVFSPDDATGLVASQSIAVGAGPKTATWRARWPGRFGNVFLETFAVRSKNVRYTHPDFGVQAKGARRGALVEIVPAGPAAPKNNDEIERNRTWVVLVDSEGKQTFKRGADQAAPADTDVIQLVELLVRVTVNSERRDEYDRLGAHPWQLRYAGKVLEKDDPGDENAVVWLDFAPERHEDQDAFTGEPVDLAIALQQNPSPRLENGSDGVVVSPDELLGEEANLDVATEKATGLEALGEIDDIAIVALPDGGTLDDPDLCAQAADRVIGHADRYRYRIAVVDAPPESSITEIREFRGRFDSTRGALYHPWVEILDPTQPRVPEAPPARLLLPPSGFVTGIYARSDIERGVFKAPANEVVRGLTKFELNINQARQDVLNPEGINALRFFHGRGNRVWGARTMSSDPEWKYVNVRRLFIYLEHSIDKATQWAVFEPNNERLWTNIRQTIEDFLLVQWKSGALMGSKPEDAYFVRCDRTTMTQNDLDNGRLICLIGVSPVKPAEYVIFRIGQWTAESRMT